MKAPKKQAAKKKVGRPNKPPEEQTVSWTIRVPPPAKAKGQLLGTPWVVEQIMKGKPPKPKT